MKKFLCVILALILLCATLVSCKEPEILEQPHVAPKYEDLNFSTVKDLSLISVTDTVTDYALIDVNNFGKIVIRLFPDVAPETVANFKNLVSQGFYNGLTFHRIIETFMIQGGDPKGNGTGGSDTNIKGEFAANGFENNLHHVRGVISMARADDYNSASSQFFIVTRTSQNNLNSLDGLYASFGYVVYGMDVVDLIAGVRTVSDKPINTVTINSIKFVTVSEESIESDSASGSESAVDSDNVSDSEIVSDSESGLDSDSISDIESDIVSGDITDSAESDTASDSDSVVNDSDENADSDLAEGTDSEFVAPDADSIDLSDLTPDDIITSSAEPTNYVKMSVANVGDMIIRLFPDVAPETVANFKNLVSQGFYNGLTFHRVIKDFMIQGGDPNGNGTGGSGTTIKGEFAANDFENNLSHIRGVVSMARADDYDSASSQFFIVHTTSFNTYDSLDGKYAGFGYVAYGQEVIDAIATAEKSFNDKPVTDIVISSVEFVTVEDFSSASDDSDFSDEESDSIPGTDSDIGFDSDSDSNLGLESDGDSDVNGSDGGTDSDWAEDTNNEFASSDS